MDNSQAPQKLPSMLVPLSKVSRCPYLTDFNQHTGTNMATNQTQSVEQKQPPTKQPNQQEQSQQVVDLAIALNQFMQRGGNKQGHSFLDFEQSSASNCFTSAKPATI